MLRCPSMCDVVGKTQHYLYSSSCQKNVTWIESWRNNQKNPVFGTFFTRTGLDASEVSMSWMKTQKKCWETVWIQWKYGDVTSKWRQNSWKTARRKKYSGTMGKGQRGPHTRWYYWIDVNLVCDDSIVSRVGESPLEEKKTYGDMSRGLCFKLWCPFTFTW